MLTKFLLLVAIFALVGAQQLQFKPGDCPPLPDVGVCDMTCFADNHCSGSFKCCRTACGGTFCTKPVTMRRPQSQGNSNKIHEIGRETVFFSQSGLLPPCSDGALGVFQQVRRWFGLQGDQEVLQESVWGHGLCQTRIVTRSSSRATLFLVFCDFGPENKLANLF